MFPGIVSRAEAATGLLVRGVEINGHYLMTDSCDVGFDQEMDQDFYIQGGPRASIGNFGVKALKGSIKAPIRVNEDFEVEDAVIELLNHAQKPLQALSMKTNHALSYLGLTVNNTGTDDNSLVYLDNLLVTKLSISVTPASSAVLEVTFTGSVDAGTNVDYVAPPASYTLGRELSWPDCDVNRRGSAMSGANSLSLEIENAYEKLMFIPSQNSARTDQPNFFSLKSSHFRGFVEEVMRKGLEKHTYLHGGSMAGMNIIMKVGPMQFTFQHPMLKITEQSLTAKIMKRKASFTAQNTPSWTSSDAVFFTIP